MTDHAWEDHAEKAFDAAAWVLERLKFVLEDLHDKGEDEFREFSIASEEIHGLEERLTDIRNRCYMTRDGDRDLAAMDKLMDDVGRIELTDKELAKRKLKKVGKVHFPENANTGVEGGIVFLKVKIGDYLNGKKAWGEIIDEAVKEVAERDADWVVLKEYNGPTPARQDGVDYDLVIFNKRTNLMNEVVVLDELRAVDEEWTRPLEGQQARVQVVWKGIPHGERPGVIGVISESYVWSFTTTHFSHLVEVLEKMPTQITTAALQKLGFKEM